MTPTANAANSGPGAIPKAAAWTDMLSRIGGKNFQLQAAIARNRRFAAASRPPAPRLGPALLRELERERTRIARELHAGAGQPLAGIKLNLEMLETCGAGLSEPARAALGRLGVLAEQALAQVRAVSHQLHPPEWQELSLEEALRRLVQSSGIAGRIEMDLDVQPLAKEPSHTAKIALYRCAQECISNLTRHSGATKVSISLAMNGPSIRLSVRDNGRGFAVETRGGHGIGLVALREHALVLGGASRISSDSNGTTVIVELPMDAE